MMKQSPMFTFLVVFTRNRLLNYKNVVKKIVVNLLMISKLLEQG